MGQLGWQNPTYRFSHWPVGCEPYGQNVGANLKVSQSWSSYANEVTHTWLFPGKIQVLGNDPNPPAFTGKNNPAWDVTSPAFTER